MPKFSRRYFSVFKDFPGPGKMDTFFRDFQGGVAQNKRKLQDKVTCAKHTLQSESLADNLGYLSLSDGNHVSLNQV